MIALRNTIKALLISLSIILSACGGGGDTVPGTGGGSSTVTTPPIAETSFNVVALESLFTGAFSAGVDINNNDSAVGLADNGTALKGVRWDITAATPLATVLEPLTGNSYSAAYAINDAGISVGESENGATTTAVFWPATSTTATALPADGLFVAGSSSAYNINELGQIVGDATNDINDNTVAVYWQNRTASPLKLANLGTLPEAFSAAYGVGDTGIIVGESLDDSGAIQAVAWVPNGAGGYSTPVVLPTLTNHVTGIALNIDDAGRVVGESEEIDGTVHGVIWTVDSLGATTDLADLGPATSATDINSAGRVAGYTVAATNNDSARIWDGLAIADQKELAPTFSHGYGINNASQVVGTADGEGFVAIPQ